MGCLVGFCHRFNAREYSQIKVEVHSPAKMHHEDAYRLFDATHRICRETRKRPRSPTSQGGDNKGCLSWTLLCERTPTVDHGCNHIGVADTKY